MVKTRFSRQQQASRCMVAARRVNVSRRSGPAGRNSGRILSENHMMRQARTMGHPVETSMSWAPILNHKNPDAPSVFAPAALIREARRQKGLAAVEVPPVCIPDPDGDILRHLKATGRANPFEGWP